MIYCTVCGCCLDLQSVTSIWTQSQHEQQTANALIHSLPSDSQSLRAGTTDTPQQPTAPSSTDSQRSRRKMKSIRQLMSSRVAPLNYAEDSNAALGADRQQLDRPVYSKFIASSCQMQAEMKDAGMMGIGAAVCMYSSNDAVHSHTHAKHDLPEDADHEDDSTVDAESEYCPEGLSDNSPASCTAADVASDDAENGESETDIHSNSNYSIASSDTAALSIKLDENYDPITEPVSKSTAEPMLPAVTKASAAKTVVRPVESRRSNIPILRQSASLPTNAATSKSNSATQTSIVRPPVGYYRQPFPYPVFGYGGYLPPMAAMCETPIWPPFAYPPPPLPWYYGGPHYDPMHYMPAAPPYCVVPPSATVTSNSNQSSLPQQTETVRAAPDSQHTITVEPTKPTVVPPSSFHEPAVSMADKLFRPIQTRSCFQPTAGSLFKPVVSGENSRHRQISRSEPVADEKLSRSLLEMVELISPQLDSGTERTSDASERQDDAEDEAEREAWEAEERERQRMRRRHTRQWMRALRTDIDHTQFSDTSF